MEVEEDWFSVQDVATPTITELDNSLSETEPGTPILPEATAASDTVTVAKITITSLTLVHPLLRSPFLTPVNT